MLTPGSQYLPSCRTRVAFRRSAKFQTLPTLLPSIVTLILSSSLSLSGRNTRDCVQISYTSVHLTHRHSPSQQPREVVRRVIHRRGKESQPSQPSHPRTHRHRPISALIPKPLPAPRGSTPAPLSLAFPRDRSDIGSLLVLCVNLSTTNKHKDSPRRVGTTTIRAQETTLENIGDSEATPAGFPSTHTDTHTRKRVRPPSNVHPPFPKFTARGPPTPSAHRAPVQATYHKR